MAEFEQELRRHKTTINTKTDLYTIEAGNHRWRLKGPFGKLFCAHWPSFCNVGLVHQPGTETSWNCGRTPISTKNQINAPLPSTSTRK
jgi:hypothetical protein